MFFIDNLRAAGCHGSWVFLLLRESGAQSVTSKRHTAEQSTRGPGEQLILINASALYEHKNALSGCLQQWINYKQLSVALRHSMRAAAVAVISLRKTFFANINSESSTDLVS